VNRLATHSARDRLPRLRSQASALIGSGALLLVAGVVAAVLGLLGREPGGVLDNPIDPAQQTAVDFAERSHWLQPWRAYLDTVPAARAREGIGINFNVEPDEAPAVARLLRRSGFARARVEFGWDAMDYGEPSRLRDPARLRTILGALRANRLRPLILLNANHGAPGPSRRFDARIVRAASRGNRRLRLDRTTARAVVPGRSGLDATDGKAADVLFTAVRRDGLATLSKPLPRGLRAGPHRATTLRYAPFGPPTLPNGRPNPAFERTLRGWLSYVGAVTREARRVLKNDEFDVEVWNELSFGSDFLDADEYYDPRRARGTGDAERTILSRTVAWLRDRSHGVAGVGIGNGFASQRPWDSGDTSPPGLTAIDKHPYYPRRRFPLQSAFGTVVPLDAFGEPSFEAVREPDGDVERVDRFTPTYDSFFPEQALTAIETEHMVRDLSPITTSLDGTPHGRRTAPPGARPPQVWVTETGLDPSGADPSDPRETGRRSPGTPSGKALDRLKAKASLRYLAAFLNKGVSAVHLYAAKDAPNGERFALVAPEFFGRLRKGRRPYPGDAAGGDTPRAVRRLVSALRGGPLERSRRLSLLSVADSHDHRQFDGDGTAAHPPLLNREVLAFFPFQVSDHRFVVPVYVMTRSLATVYRPRAPGTDQTRYDLPPASYRLEIGGVDGGRLTASASDPLTGAEVDVRIVTRERDRVVLEIPATDSPRLLSLADAP